MNVSFHHGVFMTPEKQTYVENYLLIDGSELRFQNIGDSIFQSQIEVTYIFEQRGTVIDFSKTIVKSPFTGDTIHKLSDFVDQQRFFIPVGMYQLTIRLKDLNNLSDTVNSVQAIDVRVDNYSVFFSDIYLVSKAEPTENPNIYSRNGTDYYPRISPFYPGEANELFFYAELYNTHEKLGKETPYLINIDLMNSETDEIVGEFHLTKRKKARAVEPIANKIDIEKLYTKSYVLRLQARDRDNALLASKSVEIKRFKTNPAKDSAQSFDVEQTFVREFTTDSLRRMTYCLIHQSSDAEGNFIENNWKTADSAELQRFFYGYWIDRNPLDPQAEWLKYFESVDYVEGKYSNNTQDGCATDRGRVYLKYGKPNSMSIVRNEAHSYPYEIWHYYRVEKKANAKFFFLDQKRLNEYVLGHSNVIGEPKDELWYTRLLSGTAGGSQSSSERETEQIGLEGDPYSHGSRAMDYWNNPR
jgi:GWxTD domain-containing protein